MSTTNTTNAVNTIWVDGRPLEVPESEDGQEQNLLHACLSHGLDLPYFCWHPAMGSVGACRQCAVKQFKDEDDEQGKIVMACMTAAADGTRIAIEDPEARAFRARVIEWLMTNHPHDCPVCDEGGECHLQDMTVMTGHAYRRFRFEKRTHRNQDLGPFIHHEMNRCIACYRCVRFYREYAGGRDLHALGAHHNVYFGRHEDGTLESEFSGNLVEVCPTGVFTDKTLKRHYTRKWDLQSAPSICVHCGVGCNTLAGERYGGVRRILNRYHHEVNGYFLCDRGRFGYEFANRADRVRRVQARETTRDDRNDGALRPADEQQARERLAEALAPTGDRGKRVWGIGSPRASLESNFALKSLVGAERFSTGLAAPEHELARTAVEILRRGPLPTPSLEQVRRSDAVLVLGEDPSDTAPMLALALRQAARQGPLAIARDLDIHDWHDHAVREATQEQAGPFFVATPAATRLDDLATETLRAGPERIACLGAAVARALDDGAPAEGIGSNDDDLHRLAGRIARALKDAARPVVISGTGSGSRAVMEAAANVASALARVHEGSPSGLALTVPECNTVGVTLLGGEPLDTVFDAAAGGAVDTVIVLENDLTRRAAPERLEAFFDALGGRAELVVIDHLLHATAERADLVLPAATFAEGDGTYVSSEGRAQRAYQVYVPGPDTGGPPAGFGGGRDGNGYGPRTQTAIRESWRWLSDARRGADGTAGEERETGDGPRSLAAWRRLDDVVAGLAGSDPVFAPLADLAPSADALPPGLRVPREAARFSGRTAMNADRTVHEPPPAADPDAPLSYSMEGTRRQPLPVLNPRYWAPGWNSVQSLNKFQQEVGGPLRGGDPGVRLLDPGPAAATDPPPYFEISTTEAEAPGGPGGAGGGLTVVPLPQVFGSEELSAKAEAVARRMPAPFLALHPDDARAIDPTIDPAIGEGSEVTLELEGAESATDDGGPGGPRSATGGIVLPVTLRDDLPRGVVGLPVGLPGVPYCALPAKGVIRR